MRPLDLPALAAALLALVPLWSCASRSVEVQPEWSAEAEPQILGVLNAAMPRADELALLTKPTWKASRTSSGEDQRTQLEARGDFQWTASGTSHNGRYDIAWWDKGGRAVRIRSDSNWLPAAITVRDASGSILLEGEVVPELASTQSGGEQRVFVVLPAEAGAPEIRN